MADGFPCLILILKLRFIFVSSRCHCRQIKKIDSILTATAMSLGIAVEMAPREQGGPLCRFLKAAFIPVACDTDFLAPFLVLCDLSCWGTLQKDCKGTAGPTVGTRDSHLTGQSPEIKI